MLSMRRDAILNRAALIASCAIIAACSRAAHFVDGWSLRCQAVDPREARPDARALWPCPAGKTQPMSPVKPDRP